MNFEEKNQNLSHGEASPAEDYNDNPVLYGLLKSLPDDLAALHIKRIESQNLGDEEAELYLKNILERREGAIRISEVSDSSLQRYFQGREEEIFSYIENELAMGDRNLLGEGGTAKVKAFYLKTPEIEIPMAIKYLLTPNAKTLSAAAEHDMLREVERLQKIEDLERKDQEKLKHIRVPHPYFHHKNKKVQCYGMELIDGIDLHQAIQGEWSYLEQKERLREVLKDVPLEALLAEIELFFENMHDFCLHGDVKPANIMVDKQGVFYVIDLGQSEIITAITDKNPEQVQTKKDDEKVNAKDAVRRFYRALFS